MSDAVPPPIRYRVRKAWSRRLVLQHIHPFRGQWSDVKAGPNHVQTQEFEIVPLGFCEKFAEYKARAELAERNAARHRKARAEKRGIE